jgi:TetR/AcrR family transcriptional repressor of nem operon
MPPARSVTDESVLDRALAVFWQRGYAATSLRDLTRATGLGASALYHRFTDKDGLFVEVLRRYADQGLRARLLRLSAMPSPLGAIRSFFDELIEMSEQDPDHRGCLLVNTAVDGAEMSPVARALVRARLSEVETFFRVQLVRARDASLIEAAIDPAAMAEALLGAVLAIRVFARLDPDRRLLRRLAEHALAPLSATENRIVV